MVKKEYKCFCGNLINTDMLYCSKCGKKLDTIFSNPKICIELAKKYADDKNVSFGYYWLASASKDPEAMYNLGLFYEDEYHKANMSKEKKLENYEKCYTEAAKFNYDLAIAKLEKLYPNIKNSEGFEIAKRSILEKKRIEEELKEKERKKREELARIEAEKLLDERAIIINEQKQIAKKELRSVENKINSLIDDFLDCNDLNRQISLIPKIKELLNFKVLIWDNDDFYYKYKGIRTERIYDYPGF